MLKKYFKGNLSSKFVYCCQLFTAIFQPAAAILADPGPNATVTLSRFFEVLLPSLYEIGSDGGGVQPL